MTHAVASMGATGAQGVRRWLVVLYLMVLGMVVIGGITRLSGSGLSMVDWRPLMGALPPMSDTEWAEVLGSYQTSPEGRLVNAGMTLDEFEAIFFWEYLHRLFGRLLGLAFALPFLYFLVRRRMNRALAVRTFVAFLLGGAQGLLGWYMVKSGLADVPRVSHLRLAAHLLLAFGTAQWILWIILGLSPGRSPPETSRSEEAKPPSRAFRHATLVFVSLLALQILYGAFMAGTHAGLVSATFPDMNGSYGPGAFFTAPTLFDDLLNHAPAIHYIHRVVAWLLLVGAIVLVILGRRRGEPVMAVSAALIALVALGLQFILGVGTVMTHVPTWLAVPHQVGAFISLSCGTVLVYRTWVPQRPCPVESNQSAARGSG